MHTLKLKQIALAVCFTLGASSALAASLGNILVLSNRGEPFNAEIEILPEGDDLSSLKATLASPEAYATRDVEPPSGLQTFSAEISQNPAGEPVLLLRSVEPVTESALDLLVQLNDGEPRKFSIPLQESALESEETGVSLPDLEAETQVEASEELPEFTAEMAELETLPDLLDEHPVQEMSPDEIEAHRQLQDEEIPESFGPLFAEEARADEASALEMAASPAAVSAPVFPEEGYTVQKGDTLRNIAVQHWAEGVSLDQMIAGLYRANPHAFTKSDINRLKTGEILRAPSVEALKAIEQADAERQVHAVTRDWHAYRGKVAAKASQSVPAAEEQPVSAVGGKIDSVRDQNAASGPRDVVKLSSGDAKSAGMGQSKTQLQEDLIAREKSLQEAEERIRLLEKQLQDAQRLLELRKPPISEIGKQDASSLPASAKPTETSVSGIATVQQMLTKHAALPVAGIVLVLLAALILLARRRKKPAPEASATAAVTAPAWAGASVVAAVPDEESVPVFVTSTPELEPQSEIPSEVVTPEAVGPQSAVLGMDDIAVLIPEAASEAPAQEESDDLAAQWAAMLEPEQATEPEPEAAVAEIGAEPIVEPPIEAIADTLDVDDIFTAPQEMQAAEPEPVMVGEPEPEPEPETELAPAASTAEDTFDYDSVFEGRSGDGAVAEITPTTAQLADTADVAEEMDMDAMAAEAADSGEEDAAGEDFLELDNLFTAPQEMPPRIAEEASSGTETSGMADAKPEQSVADDHSNALAAAFDPQATEDLANLDFGFDIDLGMDNGAAPVKTTQSSAPELDLSNINLEVAGASASNMPGDSESVEVDTKLDLVTAYIDMNDEDGARELLQEILKEGGPKQVARAQEMLAKLGGA